MVRITVKDVKTGKQSSITKRAYDLLKSSNKHKHLDIISEGAVTVEADKAAADKAIADKAIADKAAADKVIADKAAAAAAAGGGGSTGSSTETNADVAIEAIQLIATAEDVTAFVAGDERKTIKAAAADRISELNA